MTKITLSQAGLVIEVFIGSTNAIVVINGNTEKQKEISSANALDFVEKMKEGGWKAVSKAV